jgi:hypothetical protein
MYLHTKKYCSQNNAHESISILEKMLPTYLMKDGWLTSAGVTLQIMAVFALPPRAGCNILANLLSRYGTWPLSRESKQQSQL